ncbi:class I SAM-dependent methyltransferase [Paenibacillus illinoisensis]|uniref:class I SAM-dependent methyltransferase n=1 Tax=Paenibacillus illinoisensis TaxID=59845 RepID=UPI003CF90FF3
MSDNTVGPGKIMNQIRSGVRKLKQLQDSANRVIEEDIINLGNQDVNSLEDIKKLNTKINRLVNRITPNMPVAFTEPRLVSRYKILDKIITPMRRFGNRLFVKWYVDTALNQQKYLNNDLWFGLNNSIEILVEQNKIISHLAGEVAKLYKENSELKIVQNELQGDNRNHLDNLKNIQEEIVNFREFVDVFDAKYKIHDFQYSDFAERFSATSEEVKKIFSQYLQYFKPTDTIIDIGCGKGFFLELLTENNLSGIGVDTDPQLIKECRDKKLNAYVHEGSQYLSEQADSSIDAIFCAHVIEHLTVPQKIDFLRLSYQKLKNGGVLVIETPNTTSGYVMNNLYYLDPTHERPLFPEALKHLAVMSGFSIVNSYLSGEIDVIQDNTQYYNYSLILNKI